MDLAACLERKRLTRCCHKSRSQSAPLDMKKPPDMVTTRNWAICGPGKSCAGGWRRLGGQEEATSAQCFWSFSASNEWLVGQKGYCGHRWRTVIKAEGEKAVGRIIISRKRHQYFKFLSKSRNLIILRSLLQEIFNEFATSKNCLCCPAPQMAKWLVSFMLSSSGLLPSWCWVISRAFLPTIVSVRLANGSLPARH